MVQNSRLRKIYCLQNVLLTTRIQMEKSPLLRESLATSGSHQRCSKQFPKASIQIRRYPLLKFGVLLVRPALIYSRHPSAIFTVCFAREQSHFTTSLLRQFERRRVYRLFSMAGLEILRPISKKRSRMES